MKIDPAIVHNGVTLKGPSADGTSGHVLQTNGSGQLSFAAAAGGVSDGDKGDITVSGSGATWTIDAGAVTAAKCAADVATQAELDAVAAAAQPLDSDLTSWAGVARASGFDTFVATPSSANLAGLLSDETGSGAAVFGTSPTLRGTVLIQQTAGTPGTDEIQLSHDGTKGFIESKDGDLEIKVPTYTTGRLKFTSPDGGSPGISTTAGQLVLFAASNVVVGYFGFNTGTGNSGPTNNAYKITWTHSAPNLALSRAAAGVLMIEDGSGVGKTISSPPLTPSQITADQNNYAPGVARWLRLSTDASRSITGLVAGVSGQEAFIVNVGSNNIVLVNESASSTAANRFLTGTGADVTLAANQIASIMYDATTARWRVF